jgi:hypothetical protein
VELLFISIVILIIECGKSYDKLSEAVLAMVINSHRTVTMVT